MRDLTCIFCTKHLSASFASVSSFRVSQRHSVRRENTNSRLAMTEMSTLAVGKTAVGS